jgi:hypothetical protein
MHFRLAVVVTAAAAAILASSSAGLPATDDTAPQAPASGVIMGSFVDLPGLTLATSVTHREKQLGVKYGIDSHYYAWSLSFPTQAETNDVNAGRTPMVTWWGTDLAAINNGSQDALIKRAAERVKAFGHPMFLRWGAEMNGDWYAWSGSGSADGPSDFKSAWRRIHDIFTTNDVTNVAWVWAPNADSHPGGIDPTAANSWRNYYPGDGYVDWVGVDGYNRGAMPDESWKSFGSIFEPVYDDYADRKPIMIAETSSVDVGGDKGAWITAARAWIKSHQGVHALVWFDTSLSATKIDWRADSSAASWKAMTDLVHDPYFQAHAEQ